MPPAEPTDEDVQVAMDMLYNSDDPAPLVAALHARARRAEEDSARLDWLLAGGHDDNSENYVIVNTGGGCGNPATTREQIDAARKGGDR